MPIKIFESNKVHELESQVNKFIENKQILKMQFTVGTLGDIVKTTSKYFVIEYSDDNK